MDYRRLLVVFVVGAAAGCGGSGQGFTSAAAGVAGVPGNAGSGNDGTGGTTGSGPNASSGTASFDPDGGISSPGGAQGSLGGAGGHSGSGGTLPNAGAGGGTAGTSAGNGGEAGEGGDGGQADAGEPDCENPDTYYLDHDGDGYGAAITLVTCATPAPVVPIVDENLSTGVWVQWSGDCNDDKDWFHPATQRTDGVILGADLIYDANCNGLEEPTTTTEWIGIAENCTFVGPYQCTGGGAGKKGSRSETYPGANDLCGGTIYVCATNTSQGPCIYEYGQPPQNGCH